MAENHLEYGYLEGESIGEHFAEDPVGIIILFCVESKGCRHLYLLGRALVGRANDDYRGRHTSSYAMCYRYIKDKRYRKKKTTSVSSIEATTRVTESFVRHGSNQVHCMCGFRLNHSKTQFHV